MWVLWKQGELQEALNSEPVCGWKTGSGEAAGTLGTVTIMALDYRQKTACFPLVPSRRGGGEEEGQNSEGFLDKPGLTNALF